MKMVYIFTGIIALVTLVVVIKLLISITWFEKIGDYALEEDGIGPWSKILFTADSDDVLRFITKCRFSSFIKKVCKEYNLTNPLQQKDKPEESSK